MGIQLILLILPDTVILVVKLNVRLQMVEGFLLLLMLQKAFCPALVLFCIKALELNLKPIVLINKIDRKDADIERTESAIQDLFLDLAADESQLDFPHLYGSGRGGYVSTDSTARSGDMKPLFEAIIKHVPAPTAKADHLQFLITNLDHSDFLGPIAIGRIFSGSMKVGQQVICCKDDKVSKPIKITKIYKFLGLSRVETESKLAVGDIVAITGFNEPVAIGTTICEVGHPLPHPYVKIDEPTVSIYFSVNDSPFSGRDGNILNISPY